MAASTTSCNPLVKNFDWCPGSVELPGILGPIYYTSLSALVKRAALPVDSNGRPTSGVLAGDLEMAEGQKFKKIDVLSRKCHYTSEAQGELPSQTQLNKLDAIIASTNEAATEIGACVNNNHCVFIFRDANRRARVLGLGFLPAVSTFAQDGGEDATGAVSSTLHVESSDLVAAPFFRGSIETDEGTVNFGPATAGA